MKTYTAASTANAYQSLQERRLAPRNMKSSNPEGISNLINQAHSAEYERTLAPQMVKWQAEILLQLPGEVTRSDYTAVQTMGQLNRVCQNVMTLAGEREDFGVLLQNV